MVGGEKERLQEVVFRNYPLVNEAVSIDFRPPQSSVTVKAMGTRLEPAEQ